MWAAGLVKGARQQSRPAHLHQEQWLLTLALHHVPHSSTLESLPKPSLPGGSRDEHSRGAGGGATAITSATDTKASGMRIISRQRRAQHAVLLFRYRNPSACKLLASEPLRSPSAEQATSFACINGATCKL